MGSHVIICMCRTASQGQLIRRDVHVGHFRFAGITDQLHVICILICVQIRHASYMFYIIIWNDCNVHIHLKLHFT